MELLYNYQEFFLWVNTRFGGCIYVCVFKLREIVSGLDPFGWKIRSLFFQG